jgi:hypothetical protein
MQYGYILIDIYGSLVMYLLLKLNSFPPDIGSKF